MPATIRPASSRQPPYPPNNDVALDAIVDGTATATVVDGVALEVYQRRKPGRAEKLKVIKESNVFPAAAFLFYKPGTCDPEVVNKFYTGMIGASPAHHGSPDAHSLADQPLRQRRRGVRPNADRRSAGFPRAAYARDFRRRACQTGHRDWQVKVLDCGGSPPLCFRRCSSDT